MMTTEPKDLMLLSRASEALAQAKSVDEVQSLRHKADAVRAYARKMKLGKRIVLDAAAIKLRAERKLGLLLCDTVLAKAAPGNQHTGPMEMDGTGPPTLASLGISKNDSSRLQRIAKLPDDVFEGYVAESVESDSEPTTAGLLRLSRPSANADDSGPKKAEVVSEDSIESSGKLEVFRDLIESGERFAAVYGDPAWGKSKTFTDELCSIPVSKIAETQSHLHLWTTPEFLPDAMDVIDAWGFSYASLMAWATTAELGSKFWPQSHALLLLGVRGGLEFSIHPEINQDIKADFKTPRETIRRVIECVSPGNYLELFGETPVKGWTVCGNV